MTVVGQGFGLGAREIVPRTKAVTKLVLRSSTMHLARTRACLAGKVSSPATARTDVPAAAVVAAGAWRALGDDPSAGARYAGGENRLTAILAAVVDHVPELGEQLARRWTQPLQESAAPGEVASLGTAWVFKALVHRPIGAIWRRASEKLLPH